MSAAEFVRIIATVTRAELIEKNEMSKYISFTCDGSTDSTGEDLENDNSFSASMSSDVYCSLSQKISFHLTNWRHI